MQYTNAKTEGTFNAARKKRSNKYIFLHSSEKFIIINLCILKYEYSVIFIEET